MSTKPEPTAAGVVVQRPTANEELIRAGQALGAPKVPPAPFAPYAVLAEGQKLELLPRLELDPLPDHIQQQVRLDDSASFCAYVKAFRTPTTRILYSAPKLSKISAESAGGAMFTAFLDYHQGGESQAAKRRAHVARYPVPLSLEFSTWLGSNGKALAQMDFVQFIETNGLDVVHPDSASLMELALNFESKSNVTFQSRIDRTTGGKNLTFQEAVEHGAPAVGQMKVPDGLQINLPVFEGGALFEMQARLEYRTSGGRLAIAYHLQRPHNVFRVAIGQLRAQIAEALEAEILTGETV